ncbi:hypothetical protein DPMN_130438 [Dreissena polymorpha]|uniref:Uncharacterized protein n=1 Tax=Dreissena polymorpha TaxID=45954 RepID=A0A9D4H6Q6_DREPO|nr:hypothetical protein DPMN_130438 [Dreissena polymorpha]
MSLQEGTCSLEWLYTVLIRLSTLQHHVRFDMCSGFVTSTNETCQTGSAESHRVDADLSRTTESDLRMEMLSRDMSNIKISITNGSHVVYEMLRETNIEILNLRTTDDLLLAATTIPTLTNLKELHIWGTYIVRGECMLTPSIELISLQNGTWSSEWLYSVLIRLSNIQHHVCFEVCNCLVVSNNETYQSDLEGCVMRSEIFAAVIADFADDSKTRNTILRSEMSIDMSNIELGIMNGSSVLYDMLRNSSIGILNLRSTHNLALAQQFYKL